MIEDSIIPAILGRPTFASLVVSNSIAFADLESTFPAASYSGRYAVVVINGMNVLMQSDGTAWVPANGEATIAKLPYPTGIACTFTGTTNGEITFGTALNATLPKCYVYYDANTVNGSQPAGFYPTVFSSTTAATVYNDAWVPGTEQVWPASPTAFSGAVPGGAGVTSEVTVFSFTLPGGVLGEFGGIESAIQSEFPSTAGNKNVKIKLDGSALNSIAVTTSNYTSGLGRFRNIGSESRQRGGGSLAAGNSSVASVYSSVNTTADTTVSVTLQTSAATEWGMLFYYVAKVVK